MAAQSDRRALHAYVSDSAHDRWHDFAGEQGVSVSAVLEALSTHMLGVSDGEVRRTSYNSILELVVKDARRIDALRRRRTRE